LRFGTVSWELSTMARHGLAAAAGVRVEAVEFASNEATRVALQARTVDVIVSDWLFASRQRSEGQPLRFAPFSSAVAALMVHSRSTAASLPDLRGRRVGVSGGPLDKAWLLLVAEARRQGIDLAKDAEPVFGAPPLLAEKLARAELDAALLYWNFCARLEARGYRRLIGAGDIARAFGLKGEIALIGYMFDEALAARGPALVEGFVSSSRAAKRLLAESEAAWEPIRPLMEAEDEATFQTLRRYFVEGVPQRPVADERQDAETLFAILARLGGERLVGPGTGLPPGLYWGDPRDPA
jgi:NitT/TauT family transport system substrate-binding protein